MDKNVKKLYRSAGKQFMWGAIDAITEFACIFILIVWVFSGFTHNDCDGPGFFNHCGMTVLTDNKTGIQYLKSGNTLIPRGK
jgi:hypothetical protein